MKEQCFIIQGPARNQNPIQLAKNSCSSLWSETRNSVKTLPPIGLKAKKGKVALEN